MKKLIVFGMLVVTMCALTGCEPKDPADDAAGQIMEFKSDAREAVSEQNEDVWEMEDTAKKVEEDLE